MGGLQAKSMTSQRYRARARAWAVTRWRICVTMATLWQQQDGGYVLLWQRYDNNKMVAMRYYGKVILHLQQYRHRLNFFLCFCLWKWNNLCHDIWCYWLVQEVSVVWGSTGRNKPLICFGSMLKWEHCISSSLLATGWMLYINSTYVVQWWSVVSAFRENTVRGKLCHTARIKIPSNVVSPNIFLKTLLLGWTCVWKVQKDFLHFIQLRM